MTLPLSRTVAIARSKSVGLQLVFRRGSGLVLALLLSGCGHLPWQAESSLHPVARRRAVPTNQRREARMARPAALGNQPRVDYGVYKRIHPGMELSEVQSLLGHGGQRDGVALETDNSTVAKLTAEAGHEESGMVWRWTHASGVYNIHVRLTAGLQPDTFAVQSKWLTYNPPE